MMGPETKIDCAGEDSSNLLDPTDPVQWFGTIANSLLFPLYRSSEVFGSYKSAMIHCLLKSDGNWYLVEFLIIPQGVNFAQF
jgi:hypothetical protein